MMEAIPTISHCLDRSLVGFETTPSCCSFSVRRKGNRQGWSDEAPQLLMCQLTCHLQWPRLAVPRGQGSGRPTLTLLCATTSNGMKRECCMAQQHRSERSFECRSAWLFWRTHKPVSRGIGDKRQGVGRLGSRNRSWPQSFLSHFDSGCLQ